MRVQLRRAARTLWRNRGFTATALAMLSLGIGSVSAVFSVVDKVLLEPLPYPDPGRLVQLITTSQVGEQRLSSIPQYLYWSDTLTSFESVAAYDNGAPEVNLTQDTDRLALRTTRVSADYFHVFGAHMAMEKPSPPARTVQVSTGSSHHRRPMAASLACGSKPRGARHPPG